jgi:tetratricopeptide (TPR) repeat protein
MESLFLNNKCIRSSNDFGQTHTMKALRVLLFCLLGGIFSPVVAAERETLAKLLQEIDRAALVNDLSKVTKGLAEWKQLEPTAAAPWLKEVAIAQMSGEVSWDGCLEILRRGLIALPENANLHARLAGFCSVRKHAQEAWKHYRWLYEKAVDPAEKLSWAIQMAGVPTDGMAAEDSTPWRWFLSQSGKKSEHLLPLLASGYQRSGGIIDHETIQQAWSKHPREPLVVLEKSRAVQLRGAHLEAISDLKKLIRHEPKILYQLQLVRALIHGRQHEEALALLAKISQQNSLRAPEVETVAALYFEQCLWKEAAAFLTPHCQQEPENYRYLFLLACAQEELRELAAARANFIKLIEIRRDVVPSHAPLLALYPVYRDHSEIGIFYSPISKHLGQPSLPGEARRVRWQIENIHPWESYGYIRRKNGDYGYVEHDLVCRYHGALFIPASLEVAHTYTMQHLVALWCELPPLERAPLEAELWRLGVPAKTVFPAFIPGRIEAETPLLQQLGAAEPTMSPESQAVINTVLQQGDWKAYRIAAQTLEPSHPAMAWRAASRLGADSSATELWSKFTKLNPPRFDPAPVREWRAITPATETTVAFPELTGKRPSFTPQLAAGLKPWPYLPEAPLTLEQIAALPETVPRAIVEKAQAYLDQKKPDEAMEVFRRALRQHPGDRTLLACALQTMDGWAPEGQVILEWGLEPMLNRGQLYYLNDMMPKDRPAIIEKTLALLTELPDWRLETIDFYWIKSREWFLADARLAKACLRIPVAAQAAFEQLHQTLGANHPDLPALAEQTILSKCRHAKYSIDEVVRYVPGALEKRTPEQVVLYQARLDQSPQRLNHLIEKLRTINSLAAHRSADHLELTRELYFCPASELPNVLKRLWRGVSWRAWMRNVPLGRGIPVDVSTLVMADLPNMMPLHTNIHEEVVLLPMLQEQAEHFIKSENLAAAESLFGWITQRCLGDPAQRAKILLADESVAQQAWFTHIMSSGSNQSAYGRFLIEQFRKEVIAPLPAEKAGWAWQRLAAAQNPRLPMDGVISAFGWKGDLAAFDPLSSPDPEGPSQFGQWIKLARLHRAVGTQVSPKADFFAGNLALLTTELQPQTYLVRCYQQDLQRLQQLPAKQQQALARLFREIWRNLFHENSWGHKSVSNPEIDSWLANQGVKL